MATLREYFDTDKPTLIHFSNEWNVVVSSIHNPSEKEQVKWIARKVIDNGSATIYYTFYIEKCQNPIPVCTSIVSQFIENPSKFDDGLSVQVISRMPSEFPMDSKDFPFIGRIIFYSETPIPISEFSEIYQWALKQGFIIHYRGKEYMDDRTKTEKPLAFISHDSRDKELARSLAVELSKIYCSVWYDEFSLKVGDRLRESIEDGLKNCQKCIIILSPNFISNNGWTREEFNAVFSREILEQQDVILPIWLNLSAKDVFDYSPILSNRFALNLSTQPIEEIAKKLRAVIIKE